MNHTISRILGITDGPEHILQLVQVTLFETNSNSNLSIVCYGSFNMKVKHVVMSD